MTNKLTKLQAAIELYRSIADMPEIYLGNRPDDTQQVPAAYLDGYSEIPTYSNRSNKPTVEEASFTIYLYATPLETAETLGLAVKSTFTKDALPLTTDGEVVLIRTGYKAMYAGRDAQNNLVGLVAISYKIVETCPAA